MHILTGAQLISAESAKVEIGIDRGFRLNVFALGEDLIRVLITPPGGLRMPRTWSIAGGTGGDDLRGRDRLDLKGFPGAAIESVQEYDGAIHIRLRCVHLEVRRSPLALTWRRQGVHDGDPAPILLQDRLTQAYLYHRSGRGFSHCLGRDPAERYYGFGEKSGNADKHGRRLRMGTVDALGYDAETSDPLYKHIPFYITARADRGGDAIGLFYDNLSRGAFDLGQEIDAYHGPYRTFEASDGDLDLYVMLGPTIRDVVAQYTSLTGRMALPPRWTLSYSGSSMQYTDAERAEDRLQDFLALLRQHDIPCQSFHLSSGYSKHGTRRFVFTWDRARFPDPSRLAKMFSSAGVRLIANIKPALLTDHPLFDAVEGFQGFVRDADHPGKPHLAQFWGGEAAYLDFTNPQTSKWWAGQVKTQLLDHGLVGTWNDNNEYEIWDDDAGTALNVSPGEDEAEAGKRAPIACLRPVQTTLMLRASAIAQQKHAPGVRPFLVSRSGGPGLQRYAQTWTGDNSTDWKTLSYNLRMGHGLSLSGLFNFGHDVGGFAGPKPEPELFMRWIEQAIYWPRFTIHSWKEDGSANEPWMYPEMLPQVKAAMEWRERLVPQLYTLLWRAHAMHEPVLRPLFYDFPDQSQSYDENDQFMAGSGLLVAPVVTRGSRSRAVWLPDVEGGWYNLRTGRRYVGGQSHVVEAALGFAPVFARSGTVLPLGPSPSWVEGALTLRVFADERGTATGEIYDDDGDSDADFRSPPCLLRLKCALNEDRVIADISREGMHLPRWPELRFEDAAGLPTAVHIAGKAGGATSAYNLRDDAAGE